MIKTRSVICVNPICHVGVVMTDILRMLSVSGEESVQNLVVAGGVCVVMTDMLRIYGLCVEV